MSFGACQDSLEPGLVRANKSYSVFMARGSHVWRLSGSILFESVDRMSSCLLE